MKSRLFFLTVSLLLILLAVSCAPATVTESASPVDSASATEAIVPTSEAVTQSAVSTEVPVVQPVATSRGPDLHATDPTTVSLASGQLQLVEFFRFT
ncbi:MAG: hypothetical protein JNM46_06110 [Anaerolineales bacterium]|nr:hypothetical protein [Anaerolineales bacterium]